MKSFHRALLASSLVVSLSLLGCSKEPTETANPTPVANPIQSSAQPVVAQVQAAPRAAASIGTTVQGSCSVMGLSCSDFQGDVPATQPKAMCEKYGGKWSDAACPRERIQGICTKLDPPFRNVTYSYPPGTVETAKKACGNTPGGVFSTP